MRCLLKKIIYATAKKSVVLRKFFRSSINLKRKVKYLKYYLFNKVDDKLVLFEVFGGKSFADSPKALYNEMLKNKKYKDYHFVWSFKDVSSHEDEFINKPRTILVKENSKMYFKYYAKAKYIIVNSYVNEGFIKKDEQILVQCWHGTPLKKLRYDILVNGNVLNTVKEIRKKNDLEVKKFDYFLSPSAFATEKFISAFNLKKLKKENIILEKGYPRNDFLFNYTKNDVKKIKEKLGIKTNKKIILYAPTFRDDQHTNGVGYTYELGIDFDKLQKEIGEDYIILFRAHYFLANLFDFSKYENFIYNVSSLDDINELYVISDMILTDYSSVFFDYANLKRPMLFYMYDIDNYKDNLRGFYIDLDVLPGPIVKCEKELIKEIKNVDNYFKKYQDKYDKFNKTYNYLDGKNVSKKVLDEIIK